jgi:hypothetical protein
MDVKNLHGLWSVLIPSLTTEHARVLLRDRKELYVSGFTLQSLPRLCALCGEGILAFEIASRLQFP